MQQAYILKRPDSISGGRTNYSIIMEKLILYVKEDYLQIQRAEYIEDGWFIRIYGTKVKLYEIPYGGGKENNVGVFESIQDALDYRISLT